MTRKEDTVLSRLYIGYSHSTHSFILKKKRRVSCWRCIQITVITVKHSNMSPQLMLPKPLWHPWFCHALIIVIPCCQWYLNSWLANFGEFKIVLLESFSKPPGAHTFHRFWLNCTGFQWLRESIAEFPPCATMLSQMLLRCACLVFFAFASLPVRCVPLLTHISFGLQNKRNSFKGNVLCPRLGSVIWCKHRTL